jgi:threonine dehydratase
MSVGTRDSIGSHKIIEASKDIAPFLKKTPIISIAALNEIFGHDLYFKLENVQETGAFKVRGVISILCNLKKDNNLPKKIVTYGTGNHGLALAWAARFFWVESVKVYLPNITSKMKKSLAIRYGARVVITETRAEAESRAHIDSEKAGYVLIPPSDSDDIIAGAATVAYEALQEQKGFDSIFVPIGGGSLSSGTILVRDYMSPKTKVYAGEPSVANDSSISYKTGKIFRFENSPKTIADGATALGLSQRAFNYIKNLDGIYEISEREIEYWTVKFFQASKCFCEPTSALAIASAYRWSIEQKDSARRKILIIITGGNVSEETRREIYRDEFINMSPKELDII